MTSQAFLPYVGTIYKWQYWCRFVLSKYKHIQMENFVDTISPEIAFILLGGLERNRKYSNTWKIHYSDPSKYFKHWWHCLTLLRQQENFQFDKNLSIELQALQSIHTHTHRHIPTERHSHTLTHAWNWAPNLGFLDGSEFSSCYSKGNVYFRDCKVVKHCFKSFFIFIFFKKKV